jgi:5'-nucleotidase/UDP-sugar diphosphatase
MKSASLATLVLLASCAQLPGAKPVKLTILHTNDHHGRFWANKDGEYGLAARATLIRRLREEIKKSGGEVLLLDAGDVNTGVPQSDLLNAEPDFRGMAVLGYDAMAVGNHEFDNPLSTIRKQQAEWAKFPFISANIYHQKDKTRVFPSHVSKTIGGLRVVIFGLTTEDTPKKSKAEHTRGLYFTPAAAEAKALVPKLRPEADVLIALTHTGHYPDEKHGADAPGDVTIARQAPGIDVIVGGHTQKPLFTPDVQNGTVILQAYEWGKYVGRVDLEILDGKVRLAGYKLIPVNLKDAPERIAPDAALEAMLRPYKEQGDKSLLIKIATADQEFVGKRDVVRTQETNLGNLIAAAMKAKFKANLAVMNSGGIRDSLYPGDVTIENILTVLPFAGEVVTAELTGAELRKYLEDVVAIGTPGSGSFPQLAGVRAVLDKTTRKFKVLKIEGRDVVADRKYLVALPEFLANGGDKYPVVPFTRYGYVDADVLKEFVQKVKTLKAKSFAPTAYLRFE